MFPLKVSWQIQIIQQIFEDKVPAIASEILRGQNVRNNNIIRAEKNIAWIVGNQQNMVCLIKRSGHTHRKITWNQVERCQCSATPMFDWLKNIWLAQRVFLQWRCILKSLSEDDSLKTGEWKMQPSLKKKWILWENRNIMEDQVIVMQQDVVGLKRGILLEEGCKKLLDNF